MTLTDTAVATDTTAPSISRFQKLFRYTAGSVICFAVAEVSFLILFGSGLLGARGASIASSIIGVIPGYFLNRNWTWGRRGRSDVKREVAPYWITAVVSTVLAALVIGVVNDAFIHHSRSDRTLINAAAYMVTYGVIFVAKFLLFQRLFRTAPAAAERDDVSLAA